MSDYEDLVGPLDPGFVKTPSPELQQSLREIRKQQELDLSWITLTVTHETLPGDEISKTLQLKPDDVTPIGQTVVQTKRHHIVSDITIWRLDSSEHVPDNTFEGHLTWILEQLFGKLPSIRHLQNQGAEIRLTAYLRPSRPSVLMFPTLTVEALQRLAQLRVPLEFNIVREVDEDED